MRRRNIAALVVVAAAAGACGIDESGLLPDDAGFDASGFDGSGLDGGGVDVVQPCATLDASCLGQLDPMWKPIALADAGCGTGWTPEHFLTNPQDVPGSCACGTCSVVGAYSCEAGVPISGGDQCKDNPFATATPGQCTNVNATQHLEGHPGTATGTVGCFAPNDAGTGALADDLALCVPGCSADFCGGSSRCVYAEGDVACPSGFQLWGHAGTGTDPGCGACPCEAGAPAACTGTVTAFYNNNCNAADDAGTFDLSACTFISQQYKSVFLSMTTQQPSCSVTGAPTGDAGITGEKTICCQ
jgi:hypothetical protein